MDVDNQFRSFVDFLRVRKMAWHGATDKNVQR